MWIIYSRRKRRWLFEHLEALRWHIIRAFVGIAIVAVLSFFRRILFKTVIFGPRKSWFFTYRLFCSLRDDVYPAYSLLRLSQEIWLKSFTSHLTVSFNLGAHVAFPCVLEFWRFVKPGLYSNEICTWDCINLFCIIGGVLFGYYFIAPFALSFLAGYELVLILWLLQRSIPT